MALTTKPMDGRPLRSFKDEDGEGTMRVSRETVTWTCDRCGQVREDTSEVDEELLLLNWPDPAARERSLRDQRKVVAHMLEQEHAPTCPVVGMGARRG